MRRALGVLLGLGLAVLARGQTLGFSDENPQPWQAVQSGAAPGADGAIVERQVLAELASIDSELYNTHEQIAALDARQAEIEEQRRQHADELAAVSAELRDRRDEVSRRLHALYRVHRRGLATVIFGASDGLELRRRAEYLLWLVRAERGPLADVTRRMAEREKASAAMDADLAALQKNRQDASALQDRLVAQRAERMRLLNAIRGQAPVARQASLELDQSRARLMSDLAPSPAAPAPAAARPSTSAGFRSAFGHLPWPASGRLLRRFGAAPDESPGGLGASLGVDLAVPEGTSVRAVFDGDVALAGNIAGYGLTVALSHGPYTTVYAHLSRLHVQKGVPVQKGDPLGVAGSSGLAAEGCCTLTFEVRYNGTPQDPLPWLGRP